MPNAQGKRRRIIYCIVPQDLAAKLHDPLRRHFRDDPAVEVVVEQRAHDRRSRGERRSEAAAATEDERRLIRGTRGRRAGERRQATVEIPALELPRRAQRHAARLLFVERLEPAAQQLEDIDTARLVLRIQAGERELFSELYMRYFDRVYSYLHVALRDPHGAEDGTQVVFTRVFEALPRYERRSQPFRAWLFTIVKNHAIDQLKLLNRLEPMDSEDVMRHTEASGVPEPDLPALRWLTDRELMLLTERLPLTQRQVLMLRFMLDLSSEQIAEIMGRTPADVRMLQSRALRFLRDRLDALGRTSEHVQRPRMHRRAGRLNVLRARRFALSP